MGCVYEITFPDDSRYVGMTIQTLKERLRGHKKEATKNIHAISPYIVQYGLTAGMVSVHFESDDRDFLGLLEYEFIGERRQQGLHVLNKADGGRVNRGFTKDEETRARISKSKEGLYVGSKNPRSILNEETAAEILTRYHAGEERKTLQAEFKITPSTMGCLIQGKSWKNVAKPKGFFNPGRRKLLTDEQVQKIRVRVAAGEKRKELALEFGVSYPTICAILSRRIYDRVKD